ARVVAREAVGRQHGVELIRPVCGWSLRGLRRLRPCLQRRRRADDQSQKCTHTKETLAGSRDSPKNLAHKSHIFTQKTWYPNHVRYEFVKPISEKSPGL